MFRKTLLVASACLLASCAMQPTFSTQSEQYPKVNTSDYAVITNKLSQSGMSNQQQKEALTIVLKAYAGKPLTLDEIDRVNFYLQDSANMSEAESRREEQDRRDKEDRKEKLRQELERKAAARESEKRLGDYIREFNAISSPDEAKAFKAKYSGWNEPGDLTSKAMKKGLEAGIAGAQRCIDYSNQVIQRQKEIGAEVGYVDKAALYHAGASLVACRKQLVQYRSETAK